MVATRSVHVNNEVASVELFGSEFINSLPPLGVYYIPSVVMVCRHLHSFRKRLEDWFSHVEENDKADLKARLRDLDDTKHLGARYELAVSDYCRQRELRPRRNPNFNGLTPDYSIKLPNGQSCVLEVATVFKQSDNAYGEEQVHALLDRLILGEVSFNLAVGIREFPTGQIAGAQICKRIFHELRQAATQHPGQRFDIDLSKYGLVGSIIALPIGISSQPLVTYTGPIMGGLPSEQTMESALLKKINKYKNLNQPFIVAVCSTDVFPLNKQTLMSVLYGTPIIKVDLQSGKPEHGIQSDGLIAPNAAGAIFNKRLSGVLYVETERDEDDLKMELSLFHNPWSNHPIDAFGDLPQFIGEDDGQTLRMKLRAPNR
jgi:hypothetical protein